jgi:uncharacterized protein YcfJ
VGDRDLRRVVGAAVGAVVGREIQEKIQDPRSERRTVATTERRGAPIGSR